VSEDRSMVGRWRRSSQCGSGACVEVATGDSVVLMRDAKDPAGPSLSFSHLGWADFVGGIKAGEFDAQS